MRAIKEKLLSWRWNILFCKVERIRVTQKHLEL